MVAEFDRRRAIVVEGLNRLPGVSCIVPKVTHVDQTEHDLDVVVTEQGLADVRGMSPRERARVIINKCAHPDYRPILQDYFDMAEFECLRKGWGHEPHLLWNAYDMHKHLNKYGTMKLPKWDYSAEETGMA